MQKYRKLALLFSIPFLTTCQAIRTSLPFPADIGTYAIGNYRYLEFKDGKTYSTPEFLYQVFESRRHLINKDCLDSLQNPEKIERCLAEIDTDGDLNITFQEAIQTATSSEKVQRLEEILVN